MTVTPLTPQQTAAAEQSAASEGYAERGLIAFDMFVNVLLDGSPDETISARAGRWALEPPGLKHDLGTAVCAALGALQPDHDAKAAAGDLERAQAEVTREQDSGLVND